jgi:hypothetical protein
VLPQPPARFERQGEPRQAATITSVGQCTPSTSRDTPTSSVHANASTITVTRSLGHRWPTTSAADVAKAAITSVWPLGKLEPQYHCTSHSAGRSRPMIIFMP